MRRAPVLALAAALLLLPGCARSATDGPREPEETELLRTLGLDREGEGVRLTAAEGAPHTSENGEGRAVRLFSREAPSMSAAALAVQTGGSAYLFFGHVGELVLGEELCRAGIGEALGYVERDIEMRLDTRVFAVRGASAQELLTGAAQGESAPCDRLEAIAADAGLGTSPVMTTARDLIVSLGQNGAALVPAVVPSDDEGEDGIRCAGYAVFRGEALAGYLEGEAAAGADLLLSAVEADVIGTCAGALRVVGVRTAVRPVFREDALSGFAVECRVEANLAESDALREGEEKIGRACAEAAAAETGRITAALTALQALDADALGLARRLALAAPLRQGQIESAWREGFPRLPFTVETRVTLRRGYHIK